MPLTRRVLVVSLLCLGVFGSFLFFQDNVDRSTRSLRTKDAEIHMFASSSPELYKALREEDEYRNAQLEDFIFSSANPNSCLKDPSATKSTKEQLENFVEGDCAPVIILPGLMGTKLMVEIDCEVLQEKNPDVMEACGWNTCSRLSYLGRRPDDEYLIWIPKLNSPMNILSVQDHTCFGKLISVRYNREKKNIHDRYSDIEGIRVTWYGNTPKTRANADAGFNAVSNLLPLPLQTDSTKQFVGLSKYLTSLGYQKGLSLFAMPYDFRLTHLANSLSYSLERTIRYAYELTGKKVVIVAHSLGNLNTLPVLLKMNQSDKDRMIAAYVAVTPPFGGAAKALQIFLGGNENFMILKDVIGFKFSNQKSFIASISSGCDLIPKDSFSRFRNETWMKDLLARMDLERKYKPDSKEGVNFWKTAKNVPYSFFPSPLEMCFKGFTQRPKECQTLISDLDSRSVAAVDGTDYYPTIPNMQLLIKNHFTITT